MDNILFSARRVDNNRTITGYIIKAGVNDYMFIPTQPRRIKGKSSNNDMILAECVRVISDSIEPVINTQI